MLYVFFGTDTTVVRQEALAYANDLASEGTDVIKITETDYREGLIIEFAQGTGLFGTTEVIVLDTPSENELFEEEMFGSFDSMAASQNHFVLIAGTLNAAQKKKLKKHADKVQEITLDKKDRFNVFKLTDALLRRDKKTLWLLLTTAWKEGIPNEEIIGILFWQIKMLRLASKVENAEASGQKPFVYQKAKQALRNFKDNEIDELSRSLLSLYHDGHLGRVDLSTGLERWVLRL